MVYAVLCVRLPRWKLHVKFTYLFGTNTWNEETKKENEMNDLVLAVGRIFVEPG